MRKLINYIEKDIVDIVKKYITFFYIGLFLLIAIFAYYVLIHFPNSADEYAYIFESMTFRSGHLWNDTHPIQEVFNYMHIWASEGKWVSRFPPGYPIVLSIADFFQIPLWLVNPIISSLAVWVFFLLVRKIHGIKIAILSVLSLSLSSFFIINGASFFSHMTALLFILLFYYFSIAFFKTSNFKYQLLAGFWISFAFITRPFTALLLAIPLLIFFALKEPKRTIFGILYTILGAIPLLTFLFYYNYEITGNPFVMVTQWLDPQETLGFVKGHTPTKAINYIVDHLKDLIYWAFPFLLLLLGNILFLNNKSYPSRDWILLEISAFITIIIGYAFWHSYGGNQYGPRFYFEGYPFAIIAITAMIFSEDNPYSKRIYVSKILYFISLVLAIFILPYHAWIEHKVIHERKDVFSLVKKQNIDNAVVIISSRTGAIRSMPPGDLVRNGISLDKSVLYARDLGKDSYKKIHKFFPEKTIYKYYRERKAPNGILTKLSLVKN